MDKNAIKKYAVWARRELISRVSQRAALYDITEKNSGDPTADSVHGQVLTASEKKERQALIAQIRIKGYEEVMEEVAYTWFNRFSALRFMEVNGYLPSHVRVFTDDDNAFKPQILTEAINLDFDGLDMEKVYTLKNENKTDELFKYLIIIQCNALSSILPRMFQKIEDYTELLFPDNLLREGSAIEQMIALIPEEDWKDQVQIIGWLYQFYNMELKSDINGRPSSQRIKKEEVPAATQLFTPDWIVRYMVENSLGRLWVEGHPNDELKSQWNYYLEEAEQELKIQTKLIEIRKEYAALKPENLKCIDPCSGSGHILAYMFDVLVRIYETQGYTTRDAVRSIVENNIYGLDIDDRAAQLAYFSVMMKGRQYDSRFFRRGIQPHVYAIVESNHVDQYALEYFCNGDTKLNKAMDTIIKEMYDAKEYGSILTVTPQEWTSLYKRFDEIKDDISMYREAAMSMLEMVQVAEALAKKYQIVVTNPPYLGIPNTDDKLNSFVKSNFQDSKSDMFAVFIEQCGKMTVHNGMQAMVTMQSWMFLSSYEKLRYKLQQKSIVNMSHLGPHGFEEIGGEIVQTTTFVIRNSLLNDYCGQYVRLIDEPSQDAKKQAFLEHKNVFLTKQSAYSKIPCSPIAYWLTDKMLQSFENKTTGDYGKAQKGLDTCDVNRFVRNWYEVEFSSICFTATNSKDTFQHKWFPYAKGGEFRKWYGNCENVVLWENDGFELRNFRNANGKLKSRPQNTEDYFKPLITWSAIASSNPSMRYICNSIYGGGGTAYVPKENIFYTLALLNSKLSLEYLSIISPTLNFEAGHIMRVPMIIDRSEMSDVETLAKTAVQLAKEEWDDYEISWDFKTHPLISGSSIMEAYKIWDNKCQSRQFELQKIEEKINQKFISVYGLQGDLTPEVQLSDISIRPANLQVNIRSLISYAVGCMFGRYSLDIEGLVYAGGEWDASKYSILPADKDNIIPICDDEYFEDDIVNRFVKFIEVVYGKDTLEENIKFVADAIGGKGQPRDVIRNYFMNDFYADHLKIYQKRPIYWLFDSGKKKGFKCLIYMHRYQPDTIARIRTDYVHEQQSRYHTAIADLENRTVNVSTSERVKLNKQLKKLQEQSEEIRIYEEKIHHLADQMVHIDLNNGVKGNYSIFKDVLYKM